MPDFTWNAGNIVLSIGQLPKNSPENRVPAPDRGAIGKDLPGPYADGAKVSTRTTDSVPFAVETASSPLERVLRQGLRMDIRNFLFGGTTRQLVYKSLDASALRGRVIAQNLANVDTPGYKRKEVSFEDQLQDLIRKKVAGEVTQEGHMPFGKGVDLTAVKPEVFEAPDQTLPGEVNNVDVDVEASKMAENQILFNYAIKFAGFDKFNAAIAGRAAG